MRVLSELGSWDVNAFESSIVESIPISSIRYVTLRGPAPSIRALAQCLRLCALDILVTDMFHDQVVDPVALAAQALAMS